MPSRELKLVVWLGVSRPYVAPHLQFDCLHGFLSYPFLLHLQQQWLFRSGSDSSIEGFVSHGLLLVSEFTRLQGTSLDRRLSVAPAAHNLHISATPKKEAQTERRIHASEN